MKLAGLAPVLSPDARLLLLGSFPGARSLAEQRYYGHPQNQFWKILSELWQTDLVPLGYEARLQALRDRGLALWDVYGSCEREGSLDAAIRNPQLNDFAALAGACPRLEAVAHNGAESFRHAPQVAAALAATGDAEPFPVYKLPSTSPAHASWTFAQKCEVWRTVFRRHGLL